MKRPGLRRLLRQGLTPLLVIGWLVIVAVLFGLAFYSWQALV